MAVIFGQGGADPEMERFRREWHDWSQSEDIEGLRSALQEGQDIDEIVTNGYTSATIAAKNDLLRLFEFLRDESADLGKLDGHGRSPLMWAAFSGSKRVAQKMLSRADGPTRLAQADPTGKQPLHFAAMNGQASLIEILLSKGADVNAVDHDGRSPLHYSMIGGSPAAVKALLAKGADASIADKDGRPPEKMPRAQAACRKALSEGGSDMGFSLGSFGGHMALGSMGGHMGGGSSSAASSSSSSSSSSYGMSSSSSAPAAMDPDEAASLSSGEATDALWEALSEDEDEAAAMTLTRHSSADLAAANPDYLDATPLHVASSFGSGELIAEMIAKGAPVDALDSGGRSALFWAVESENALAASALIKAGADLSLKDAQGESCLDRAKSQGLSAIADEIEAGSASARAKPRI